MSKSKKLNLNNITLVCIGSTKVKETLLAINICKKHCKFKDIIFFSDQKNPYQCAIDPMRSIKDYDKFSIFELPFIKFDTDFILIVHWDGFIVNPQAWTSDFLKYDYIGAPWPWMNNMVGNGGFCLRSKRFLEAQQSIVSSIQQPQDPDDVCLSVRLRSHFNRLGCVYGDDVGYRFSTEYGGYYQYNSFGFHDFRPNPQFKQLVSKSN